MALDFTTTTTVARPDTTTAWFNDAVDSDEKATFLAWRKENWEDLGKFAEGTSSVSADGLTKTVTRKFRSKEDCTAYLNDETAAAWITKVETYQSDNGLTRVAVQGEGLSGVNQTR